MRKVKLAFRLDGRLMTTHEYNEMLILDPLKPTTKLTEHEEQSRFVQWLDWMNNRGHKLRYFAIPNGANKSKTAASKFKREGLVSGAPDIVIALEDGRTLWIEMKVRKGGTISPEQKKIHAELKELSHHVHVAKGAREAAEIVKDYIIGWGRA